MSRHEDNQEIKHPRDLEAAMSLDDIDGLRGLLEDARRSGHKLYIMCNQELNRNRGVPVYGPHYEGELTEIIGAGNEAEVILKDVAVMQEEFREHRRHYTILEQLPEQRLSIAKMGDLDLNYQRRAGDYLAA